VAQFTVVLHAESLISCHNLFNFFVCFNKQSRPGISYFQSKIVVFQVDIGYAEAIGAAKLRTALSASLEQ
jgi:hypothetical protein